MIKLIIFNDGNVTFDYNEEGLKELNEQQMFIESIFGTVTDEKAFEIVKEKYPNLTNDQIIEELKIIFRYAYKEIIPGFLKTVRENNPNVEIAIATEHTKYISDYLDEYVDQYFISNDLGFNKNDPRFYKKIITQTALLPRDILYIDYDEENITLASKVGMSIKKVEEKDLNLFDKVVHTQLGHRLIDILNIRKEEVKRKKT